MYLLVGTKLQRTKRVTRDTQSKQPQISFAFWTLKRQQCRIYKSSFVLNPNGQKMDHHPTQIYCERNNTSNRSLKIDDLALRLEINHVVIAHAYFRATIELKTVKFSRKSKQPEHESSNEIVFISICDHKVVNFPVKGVKSSISKLLLETWFRSQDIQVRLWSISRPLELSKEPDPQILHY